MALHSETKGEVSINTVAMENAAGKAVAGTVAGVIAHQFAKYVWSKMRDAHKPKAYSEEQQVALARICECYEENLGHEAPIEWKLDEEKRPQHFIRDRNWVSLVSKKIKKHDSLGILHHYVRTYVGLAAGFLLDKRTKRYFDKGHDGDYIEQFFSEEINWGLNVMLSYDADKDTIASVDKRIDYLRAVRDKEGILVHSKLTSSNTHRHTQTVESMIGCLRECRSYMTYALELYGARECLNRVKISLEETLDSCFSMLYRLRSDQVTVPLTMTQWFEDRSEEIESLNKFHDGILNTHTGAMLQDLIQKCGPAAFGAIDTYSAQLHDEYFENSASFLRFHGEDRPKGTPSWIKAERADLSFLKRYHSVCSELLPLAEAHRIITLAYELTGLSGDMWAYGSQEGQSVMALLVDLVREQTTKLHKQIDALYSFSEEKRKQYFKAASSIDSSYVCYKIWRDADSHYQASDGFIGRLNTSLTDLASQMAKFPKTMHERLHKKRQELYICIKRFICTHRTDLNKRIVEIESLRKEAETTDEKGRELKQAENVSPVDVGSLQLHVERFNDFAYLGNIADYNITGDVSLINRARKPWRVSDNWDDWVNGFVQRNAGIFDVYRKACIDLGVGLGMLKQSTAEELDVNTTLVKQWQSQAATVAYSIQATLDAQRPAWRFYKIWRIPLWPKTAGWPFNSRARGFYEHLRGTINDRLENLSSLVTTTITEVGASLKQDALQKAGARIHLSLGDAHGSSAKVSGMLGSEEAKSESKAEFNSISNCFSRADMLIVLSPLRYTNERGTVMPLSQLNKNVLIRLVNYNQDMGVVNMLLGLREKVDIENQQRYLDVLAIVLDPTKEEEAKLDAIDTYYAFIAEHGEAQNLTFRQRESANSQSFVRVAFSARAGS